MNSIFETILNTIFPVKCLICGMSNVDLCSDCLASIPHTKSSDNNSIYSLYSYKDKVIKELIWKLKYKNRRSIAKIFGRMLFDEIIGTLNDKLLVANDEKILLIPIPLHKKRLRMRGYNQSDLIAQAIMTHDTHNIFEVSTTILRRTKDTAPQARSQKRDDRFQNLAYAFEYNHTIPIKNKVIVLIDDITTTGATIDVAKKTLKKGLPRDILAFTVAH